MRTMRSAFSFVSLLAAGLLTAGLLAVIGTGPMSRLPITEIKTGTWAIDYVSLALGVFVGLLLSTLQRITWGDIPRRVLAWIAVNRWNIRRAAWAAIFLGIILFY